MADNVVKGVVQDPMIYSSPEMNFYIFKLDNKVKCKGNCPFTIKPGDSLVLEGKYVTSDFDGGREFKFRQAQIDIPKDGMALLEYMVHLADGFGPAKRDAIWEAYGDDWINNPDLELVSGIGPKARLEWRKALMVIETQESKAQAVGFLLKNGASNNLAVLAAETWGDKCLVMIQRNPYILAELPRYGFIDADKIAMRMGFDINAEERVDACCFWSVRSLLSAGGNTIATPNQTRDKVKTHIPEISNKQISESVHRLVPDDLHIVRVGEKSFVTTTTAFDNDREIYERFCTA